MRLVGPETKQDRELREWFATQERGNVERLEAGAQTMMQVISGLYGVLFAVLALSDQPTYLQLPRALGRQRRGVYLFCLPGGGNASAAAPPDRLSGRQPDRYATGV
ncbi:hypothetical protein [Chloroflexus sp.]|uniref:hypothetical protein n=1 Tax=Chloroflexus sp. TaxID=1904827 RepID=UPI002ADD9C2D|nr:hypothetical protein [Chloroflexus sp.]